MAWARQAEDCFPGIGARSASRGFGRCRSHENPRRVPGFRAGVQVLAGPGRASGWRAGPGPGWSRGWGHLRRAGCRAVRPSNRVGARRCRLAWLKARPKNRRAVGREWTFGWKWALGRGWARRVNLPRPGGLHAARWAGFAPTRRCQFWSAARRGELGRAERSAV